MAPPVASNLEMTCTRVVCHVYYSIPPEALPLLRGITCPTCRRGQLEVRHVAQAADAPRSARARPDVDGRREQAPPSPVALEEHRRVGKTF